MRKIRCISCGNSISKSALHDPYLCRGCEKQVDMEMIGRYSYLDE